MNFYQGPLIGLLTFIFYGGLLFTLIVLSERSNKRNAYSCKYAQNCPRKRALTEKTEEHQGCDPDNQDSSRPGSMQVDNNIS